VDVRVLIIAPYAPERCGIASYAVQLAAGLRREGHHVEVLSREPSAADHHADLHTWRGVLRALTLSRRFDRTIIELRPDLLFPTLHRDAFIAHYPWVALLLSLGGGVELVVHQAPYEALSGAAGPGGRLMRAMWHWLVRLPRATFVHTPWERAQLTAATGASPERIGILDHGRSFMAHTRATPAEARVGLGLRDDRFRFLCIGFLQASKGFDRAVAAVSRLPSARVHLHVVGSMRVRTPDVEAHAEDLRCLVVATPGASLHEGFVTDELFDRWILACDAVVLPYRETWSSGVLERAKLHGKPAIVTDVGGIRDQATRSTRLVRDDEELCAAMAELAGVQAGAKTLAAGRWEGGDLREIAMEHVRRRADRLREAYAGRTSRRGLIGGAAGDHADAMAARIAQLEREVAGLRRSIDPGPAGLNGELVRPVATRAEERPSRRRRPVANGTQPGRPEPSHPPDP
jgi:glycosyltransferase involved in cell wall biosynthesis